MSLMQGPQNPEDSGRVQSNRGIERLLEKVEFESPGLRPRLQLSPSEKNVIVDLFLAKTSGGLGDINQEQTTLLRQMALQYIDPSYFAALAELRERLRIPNQMLQEEDLTKEELDQVIEHGPAEVNIELLSKLLLGSVGNFELIYTKVITEVLSENDTDRSTLWLELIEDAMAKQARAMGEKRSTMAEIAASIRDTFESHDGLDP